MNATTRSLMKHGLCPFEGGNLRNWTVKLRVKFKVEVQYCKPDTRRTQEQNNLVGLDY